MAHRWGVTLKVGKIRAFGVIAACALSTACGGGGGSSSPQPTSNSVQPAAPVLSTQEAGRFLVQASFGPSKADIESLSRTGYEPWIDHQLALPPTTYLDRLIAIESRGGTVSKHAPLDLFWEAGALAPDQLRQRMVFALSEILVISTEDPDVERRPLGVAYYMDVLSNNAFGNYRDLLEDVTYSPVMAEYLTYLKNRKANMRSGRVPDENYARELMQLFTIGLVELNQNGGPRAGSPETYSNEDIKGLAKVFTGLSLDDGTFGNPNAAEAYYRPLRMYEEHHSEAEKSFLGLTIPAGTDGVSNIDMALDRLIEHRNTAPFISRQLIQRFVTSNPSLGYVRRVADAFESGRFVAPSGKIYGDGRKGDLTATLTALLLDPEARGGTNTQNPSFGKVREPALRFWHWARAFGVTYADASELPLLQDTEGLTYLTQQPFRAPSVFNFFRPSYIAPNSSTGDASLVGPELQIASETSQVGYVNFMSAFIRTKPGYSSGASRLAFQPDYSAELALAERPDELVDRLDEILTYGSLQEESRTRIISVLNEIAIGTVNAERNRQARVHTAILMIMTSPEFLVQK
ncbi:MAG: DUF1800 domain-containing protein [Parvularcula sp.]